MMMAVLVNSNNEFRLLVTPTGPVFLRLSWHAAGTYDKYKRDGGSE